MKKTPWTREEMDVLRSLDSPLAIQAFLDGVPYSTDEGYRCPRSVLRDRRAHCFEGAVFAAAALERLGHPPALVDMGAVRDDDHVIALFRANGGLGAIAKSNFVGIRFREPVYRSLRELVVSYFDSYFNLERERSLRTYSRPVVLSGLGGADWRFEDSTMDRIAERLESARHYRLLTPAMESSLALVDERTYTAGMVGTDLAGVYRPGKEET